MDYKNYKVTGIFYKNSQPCRKVLFIKKTENMSTPDLLVLMMNPGASRRKCAKNFNEIPNEFLNSNVETIPDKTQYKIMDFMFNNGLEHACVLNLSDICNQHSNQLNQTIIENHSSFDSVSNAKEIIAQFAPNATRVIVAWGCKTIFKSLIYNAKQALAELGFQKVLGYNQIKDKESLYFYHPLVRNKNWLQNLTVINLE